MRQNTSRSNVKQKMYVSKEKVKNIQGMYLINMMKITMPIFMIMLLILTVNYKALLCGKNYSPLNFSRNLKMVV